MTRITTTYALAGAACLAIAFATVGNAFAQEQQSSDEQNQSQKNASQPDQDQSEEQKQADSDSQSDEQKASTSDSQKEQQARQRQQRQQQERQRLLGRLRDQGRQIEQQSQQRDQQSPDSRQSWDSDRSRQWPEPNSREYGSDSLNFRSEQQFSRDARRSESSGRNQAGLGVQVISDGRGGVVVSQVHEGSPAEEMGIRQRDRITQVNGREVQSVQEFIARIRNMEPGQQVELDIRRAAGGNEQTVRGELESRDEALAESDQQSDESYSYQPSQSDQYSGQQRQENWQTSYDEGRTQSSQNRDSQISSARLDQIERQVDRLSREIDDLRASLQGMRRQSGQSNQFGREQTASYDEYRPATSPRQSSERWQGETNRYRQSSRPGQYDAERTRDSQRTTSGQQSDDQSRFDERRSARSRSDSGASQPRDSYDEGPGGEIGEDRQSVDSENINRE